MCVKYACYRGTEQGIKVWRMRGKAPVRSEPSDLLMSRGFVEETKSLELKDTSYDSSWWPSLHLIIYFEIPNLRLKFRLLAHSWNEKIKKLIESP